LRGGEQYDNYSFLCNDDVKCHIVGQTVFQSSDDARVYLHLGVAVKSNTFKLETTAWNGEFIYEICMYHSAVL